jgi:hypothetical protein
MTNDEIKARIAAMPRGMKVVIAREAEVSYFTIWRLCHQEDVKRGLQPSTKAAIERAIDYVDRVYGKEKAS